MRWSVILGSSSAGHHCCLRRLQLSQCCSHEIRTVNKCMAVPQRHTEKGESFPEIREDKTWCYPWKYIYFKTCTSYSTKPTVIKAKWSSGKNLIFPSVLWYAFSYCFPLLAVGAVKAHCVFGEYSPLRLYVRCQLRHSNFLKVIMESHNVFKHKFTTKIFVWTRWHQSSTIGFNFTRSIIKLSRSLWYYFLPRILHSQHSNPNIDIAAMKSAGHHCISLGCATGACGGNKLAL